MSKEQALNMMKIVRNNLVQIEHLTKITLKLLNVTEKRIKEKEQ